jgi:iron complex transport system ATP-binding protein
MTCYEIVATGRYPYTGRLGILSKEDEDIVEESLKRVHAVELGSKNFDAISDGQRQRILLARALCQQPEIILLDEPTSFLDIKHKLELLAILRSMAKEKNITVIMSLHEIDLAQKISDKVICVKGDHISLFGEPENIFTYDNIRDLYSIDNGSYDPLYGSIELPRPKGEPDTFVISSCGKGIPVFRKLQKENAYEYNNSVQSASKEITQKGVWTIYEVPYSKTTEYVQFHICEEAGEWLFSTSDQSVIDLWRYLSDFYEIEPLELRLLKYHPMDNAEITHTSDYFDAYKCVKQFIEMMNMSWG